MESKSFNIEIGGYKASSAKITWEDGALHYYEGFSSGFLGDGEIIQPSEVQWQNFWEELDRLRIWDWQDRYDSFTYDGTQWSVEIDTENKSINSYGNNCYPKNDESLSGDTGDKTKLFDDFLSAISALIGREFR